MNIIKYNNVRGRNITLSRFSCESSIVVGLEFGDAGFCGGRKSGEPGKTPRSKVRTNNKVGTHMAPDRNRTRATLVGGSAHTTAPSRFPVFSVKYLKSYLQSLKKFIHDVCDQHWSVIHALTVFH